MQSNRVAGVAVISFLILAVVVGCAALAIFVSRREISHQGAGASNLPSGSRASLEAHTISTFLEVVCRRGPHLRYANPRIDYAWLYARMNGYTGNSAQDDFGSYTAAICYAPNFTPEGKCNAFDDLWVGIENLCRHQFADLCFDTPRINSCPEAQVAVEKVRNAVRDEHFLLLCDEAKIDPFEIVKDRLIELRKSDIKLIMSKVIEKEAYIKPLFLRALAKSKNDYGDYDYSIYIAEIERFLTTYFSEDNLSFYDAYECTLFVMDFVDDEWISPRVDKTDIPQDGIDFEFWCADKIEQQGWSTRVSKSSGDQGIDIEAMRSGISVAIQCKRYANSIGNKAVQEAYAGMRHYGADIAVVIGTGGFTKAAIELARNTDVILLDADNIDSFSDLVEDAVE